MLKKSSKPAETQSTKSIFSTKLNIRPLTNIVYFEFVATAEQLLKAVKTVKKC